MNRPLPVLIILCTVFFSALAGTFAWAANNEVTRTLDVDLDNGELKIELTEDDFDDLEVHWTIEMPAVATTSLNLAVGQLIARVGATALDVNVGVGQAAVTAARMDTGHIEASAGVGSATLHGVNRSDSQRAFVSENAEGFGQQPVQSHAVCHMTRGIADKRLSWKRVI